MTVLAPLPSATVDGRRIATGPALATFVFGFFGMALYSLTGPAFGALPTIWQSWGGTVGDIVLPFVVYSLVRAVQLLGPCRVHGSSYVIAAIGGLGGAAAQATWLLDPRPHTNWMLVAPHSFSAIGWYHFAFLVLVSGGVAGTTWELLLRGRRATRLAPHSTEWQQRLCLVLGSRATAAALTSFLVFAAAVAADSVSSLESLASIGTTSGALAGPTVALLVTVALLRSAAQLLVRPLVLAMVTASVLVGTVVAVAHLL